MNDLLARLVRGDCEVPAPAAPGDVALAAVDVGFEVDGRWLVRGVDLDVVAGRVLAVIGPNGAGKSTLLSVLAGDMEPSSGEVRIGGQPMPRLDTTGLARRRAVLPQRTVLSFPFTVAEVVAMGRAPWAGTAKEDDDEVAVDDALEGAGIAELAPRRFPTLSGGEQAQTSFARVLVQGCGVLLLDEPTAALDLRHQEQLMGIARRSADAGCAVLVVLHDIQLAAAFADEIAVLAGGRLVGHGPPEGVLTEDLLEQVYQLPIDVVRHPDHGGLVISPRRALCPGRGGSGEVWRPHPGPCAAALSQRGDLR